MSRSCRRRRSPLSLVGGIGRAGIQRRHAGQLAIPERHDEVGTSALLAQMQASFCLCSSRINPQRRINDAATRLDPLDRDGRMLDHFTRNSFEFCFCYQQTHQTNPEQGSAKYSGSMISPPHRSRHAAQTRLDRSGSSDSISSPTPSRQFKIGVAIKCPLGARIADHCSRIFAPSVCKPLIGFAHSSRI